jgi:type IV secretory pathway VirB2 component (pilin)
MAKFFSPNISTTGRVLRAIWGLALIAGGLLLWGRSKWGSGLLVVAGAFALFEAARGWCVMRACGVRTRY